MTKLNNQEWDAEEVKTLEHDEMVLYLMNNALEVFSKHSEKIMEIKDIKTEVPVKTGYNKDFILGYIDLVIKIEFRSNEVYESFLFFVEVKPKVDNFGNLIRQINKYRTVRTYSDASGMWVIYTKECSKEIRKALSTQKVHVIIA